MRLFKTLINACTSELNSILVVSAGNKIMENAAQPTKEFAGFQGLNICAVGAVYKNDTPRHFRSALKSVFRSDWC